MTWDGFRKSSLTDQIKFQGLLSNYVVWKWRAGGVIREIINVNLCSLSKSLIIIQRNIDDYFISGLWIDG